ncbi:MAG: hypothetical protein ACXW1E_05895 [Halobacteriota archaeon]
MIEMATATDCFEVPDTHTETAPTHAATLTDGVKTRCASEVPKFVEVKGNNVVLFGPVMTLHATLHW